MSAPAALTRRELTAGIVAAPLAALLAAPGATGQVSQDAPFIRALVVTEQATELAYRLAAGAVGLDRRTRTLLELIHSHERAHLHEMITDLQQVSTEQVPALRPAQLFGPALGLARARGAQAALGFAAALEAGVMRFQLSVLGKLQDARTLQSLGSVLGSEAQHLVLLREALGREPLPAALETGRV